MRDVAQEWRFAKHSNFENCSTEAWGRGTESRWPMQEKHHLQINYVEKNIAWILFLTLSMTGCPLSSPAELYSEVLEGALGAAKKRQVRWWGGGVGGARAASEVEPVPQTSEKQHRVSLGYFAPVPYPRSL